MAENFLGEIRMFGGTFAINGWALCNGQLMSIAENTALFSLIGTTYGGDGVSTFALPDLRGRLPMAQGQGPGLSNRVLGQVSGSESVTLLSNQMPLHSHTFSVTQANATTSDVSATVLPGTATATPPKFYAVPGTAQNPQVPLAPTDIGPAGGSEPHSNLMPSMCVTFIIALEGIFPSQG